MNDTTSDWSYGLRASFYALTPSETYYDSVADVPNIIAKAVPAFLVMVMAEAVVLCFSGHRDSCRLYNTIVNFSTAGLAEASKDFLFRGAELSAYVWVFDHYRLGSLPWDSLSTYLLAIVGVDFLYYWWHRASHEVAIMWTAHYVHHSSEDFNISVLARNSFTVKLSNYVFFLPLAVMGLPPAVFLVHSQLGFVWGVWVHSETVPKLSKVIPVLGDLIEFIAVTPSHHRVHHSANKYALDKNYGQLFIIFDRMFGTFAEEREDESLTYGTIGQHKTFHIVGIQVVPWVELWHKVCSMDTLPDKLRALFYGPGWTPGKPRLGHLEDVPDVRNRRKYGVSLPVWFSLYEVLHCGLVFYSYVDVTSRIKVTEGWTPLANLVYIVASYTSLGGMYDAHLYTLWLEPARLLVFLGLCQILPMLGSATAITWVSTVNVLSLLLWPAVASVTRARAKEADRPEAVNGHVLREKTH